PRRPPPSLEDALPLPLGELDDLGLRGLTGRLLARLAEQPVALALRLGQHLLALLDDPARLLDLLGNGRPHLVEDLVDLLAVDPNLVGEGDGLRVVDEVVELVYQNEDVHGLSLMAELGRAAIRTDRGARRPDARRRTTGRTGAELSRSRKRVTAQ